MHDLSVLEFERPIADIEKKIDALMAVAQRGTKDVSREILELSEQCEKLKKEIFANITPWQRVQLARHPKRPYMLDYVKNIFTDFVELHGDRNFGDDKAMICGFAMLNGRSVAVIGQQKGRDIRENMVRNFASAHPEGYRKALRVMKLAEKFDKPIITFIDTMGAYCGIDAEERGQAEAIARNLREMSVLTVPVISIVIGEGGSGGALGIGVANRVLMLENAYYSVISPEGCASILFRDAAKAGDAAKALKMTSQDLFKLGVIDEIIPEPLGGAHRDYIQTSENIKGSIEKNLKELAAMSLSALKDDRYDRFRKLGVFNKEGKNAAETTAAVHKPARKKVSSKK